QSWCGIARVLHDLRHARIGLMGHVLEAMLDMHTDPTAVTAHFGCHVTAVEPHDLMRHYKSVDASAIDQKKKLILGFFDTPEPESDPVTQKLTDSDLELSARCAVALENLIKEKKLT